MTSSPQLRPLGELLGTEALDIDLSRPLDEATFAWIGVCAENSDSTILVMKSAKNRS
jgi:hypothetical protein